MEKLDSKENILSLLTEVEERLKESKKESMRAVKAQAEATHTFNRAAQLSGATNNKLRELYLDRFKIKRNIKKQEAIVENLLALRKEVEKSIKANEQAKETAADEQLKLYGLIKKKEEATHNLNLMRIRTYKERQKKAKLLDELHTAATELQDIQEWRGKEEKKIKTAHERLKKQRIDDKTIIDGIVAERESIQAMKLKVRAEIQRLKAKERLIDKKGKP